MKGSTGLLVPETCLLGCAVRVLFFAGANASRAGLSANVLQACIHDVPILLSAKNHRESASLVFLIVNLVRRCWFHHGSLELITSSIWPHEAFHCIAQSSSML